jgi:hypothetical protein
LNGQKYRRRLCVTTVTARRTAPFRCEEGGCLTAAARPSNLFLIVVLHLQCIIVVEQGEGVVGNGSLLILGRRRRADRTEVVLTEGRVASYLLC